MNPEHMQAASTVLIFVLPFVAWGFYGIGLLVDRMAKCPVLNGASLYIWLSVAFVLVLALANRPEAVGRMLVAFSISWFVARALSKKYKQARQGNKSEPVV